MGTIDREQLNMADTFWSGYTAKIVDVVRSLTNSQWFAFHGANLRRVVEGVLVEAGDEYSRAALRGRCECRFEDGVTVVECHYHECQRSVLTSNDDPSELSLREQLMQANALLLQARNALPPSAWGLDNQIAIYFDAMREAQQ